ncbi:OsmC family protein [Actinomycetes bacterium NPDC127524]
MIERGFDAKLHNPLLNLEWNFLDNSLENRAIYIRKLIILRSGNMADMKINVNALWDGGVTGYGTLKAEYLNTKIAIPTSLGGSGNGANPKEVLVASVTTCYTATLTFVLESRNLPVAELTVNSKASITDNEFKITHYPNIVLSAEATEEQILSAQRATEAADKGCDVGNILKKADVKIEVQAKVTSK